jgi:PAS domain S-box-containing protein
MPSDPHASRNAVPQGVDYYRQLCQYTGIGVIATNTRLEISFWNASATRLFGASSELMIGQPIASIVPSERRGLAVGLLRRAIDDMKVSEFEIRHRDADGNMMYLMFTISPILDERANPIGASACVRNITRRVEMERKLAQSQRLASLSTFAGGVAHHFNNLLGGIATTVDYAMESGDHVTARRALRLTADAVVRASRLVENLLSFSEGDWKETDLADVTETVCYYLDKIEESLRSDAIDLQVVLGTSRIVPVPFNRMLTILKSLITNSREAMPKGGSICVTLQQDADHVILQIEDTGAGISEEDLPHVFEPFFSTKQDQREGEPRSGLGLAVVHGLVTDLGGSIQIRSRRGEGTLVEVVIPDVPAPHADYQDEWPD